MADDPRLVKLYDLAKQLSMTIGIDRGGQEYYLGTKFADALAALREYLGELNRP